MTISMTGDEMHGMPAVATGPRAAATAEERGWGPIGVEPDARRAAVLEAMAGSTDAIILHGACLALCIRPAEPARDGGDARRIATQGDTGEPAETTPAEPAPPADTGRAVGVGDRGRLLELLHRQARALLAGPARHPRIRAGTRREQEQRKENQP
jgi:hypothetical protein